ncbi:MAG: hypothetical protein L0220_08105 [Acidobacteria bacterium]|nr:hypothetical protein [Acidobacteriota bacterium]
MRRALTQGRPEDQGLQYAATDCVAALEQHEFKIRVVAVGHAEENGNAGRVIRTIKEDYTRALSDNTAHAILLRL